MAGLEDAGTGAAAGPTAQRHDREYRLLDAHRGGEAVQRRGRAAAGQPEPDVWKLRGKLDVPKERWICYPGAERAGDDSPLIAWAGWDHLQQAQALAEYFIDAQTNQGWPPARLIPLLAALADLIPWLKQWHDAYGTGLGDYFAGFLEEQCRALGMTVQEVDGVRFEANADAAPARARKQAKKRGRKAASTKDSSEGEIDEEQIDK